MLQSARPAHGRHRRRLKTRIARARVRLRRLYHGHTRNALRFQMAVLLVDMAIIAFFVFSPILRDDPSFLFVDYSVAAILAADVAARCFAARNPLKWLRQPFVLLDLVILATLLFPYTFINFGFLRIVRLWSISQSGVLWRPLRRWGHKDWEQLARATEASLTPEARAKRNRGQSPEAREKRRASLRAVAATAEGAEVLARAVEASMTPEAQARRARTRRINDSWRRYAEQHPEVFE